MPSGLQQARYAVVLDQTVPLTFVHPDVAVARKGDDAVPPGGWRTVMGSSLPTLCHTPDRSQRGAAEVAAVSSAAAVKSRRAPAAA